MDPLKGNTSGALEPENVSTKRERIATLAKQALALSLRACLQRRVRDGVLLTRPLRANP